MSLFDRKIQLNKVRIQRSDDESSSTYSDNVTVEISKETRTNIAYILIHTNRKVLIDTELDKFDWIEESSIDGIATIESSVSTKIIMMYNAENPRMLQFFTQLNQYLSSKPSSPRDSINNTRARDQIYSTSTENPSRVRDMPVKEEYVHKATDEQRPRPRSSTTPRQATPLVRVCEGDLIRQNTDVIVVCISSQYLFDGICKAGGDAMKASYHAQWNRNPDAAVIDVKADGQLQSKRVYFLPWEKDSDQSLLRKSIREFVRNAITTAVSSDYQSIAFPAIGCGQYGCPTNLVAEEMIDEAQLLSRKHGISVLFVIQPQRTDIYDEFQKQINPIQQPSMVLPPAQTISVSIKKGLIAVETGDIATQKVDAIVISSSSQNLRDVIIRTAGEQVKAVYDTEYKNNPNALLISTPSGNLSSKQIFFVKWQPDQDDDKLRQSLDDLVSLVIQNVKVYKFTSIALPAIGCGQHNCSLNIVVNTLVKEMKRQLEMRDLPLTVKFVIQADQQHIYDEFCKQLLATEEVNTPRLTNYQIPATWEISNGSEIRFTLSNTSDEYRSVINHFELTMPGKYTQIIQIERIQIESWYIQYLAHSQQFYRRLRSNTERRLYHGCPESAVNLILADCFNRSCAGVNGTLYGVGVYFSANPGYSHGYTKENSKGERHMFVVRALIGNTIKGDKTMKTRPVGYDSTTDGDHIFVTYHDAQAYPEYVITYR